MKSSFLLLLCCSFFFGLHAQSTQFIEITVEDTVSLHPLSIQYLVTESISDAYDYDEYKKEETKYTPQTNLARVEKILKTNKYSYSTYTESNTYRINNTYNYDLYKSKDKPGGLLIELKSEKELKSLYTLLKEEKGIKGKIQEVLFEQGDKYTEVLLKRLYAKAGKEAEMLASLTGMKLGKVISVTEVTSSGGYSIWDWYKDLFTLGKFYDDGLASKNLTTTYSRKFTFKFETN